MTAQEYKEYEQAFDSGSEGMQSLSSGANHACSECNPDEVNEDSFNKLCHESHFSWSACNLCGSSLGGNREPAHYIDDRDELCHIEVCEDCVYCMEYGRLDDQTMLDIEDSENEVLKD